VDELGGLTEAIARARALAGLAPDARVNAVGESSGLLDALGEDQPASSAGVVPPRPLAGTWTVAAELLARVAPEVAPFAESLAPLGEHERVVCALPFALTVR
jgi:ClpP class serine protease